MKIALIAALCLGFLCAARFAKGQTLEDCQKALDANLVPTRAWMAWYKTTPPAIVPLVSENGIDVYGLISATRNPGVLAIYNNPSARHRASASLMRRINNPHLSPHYADDLKYQIFEEISLLGDPNQPINPECHGVQCLLPPYAIDEAGPIEDFIPRSCLKIPANVDFFVQSAWNSTGGYSGGPFSVSMIEGTDSMKVSEYPSAVKKAIEILITKYHATIR